jgi:asparagine synthase (glutamine-hydrolysing)
MCGIVGIVYTRGAPVERDLLKKMTDAISHRGPTGEGIYLSGSIGIGNRRLAIIDLEGGRQPLSNEDNQIWITYNGEIYNFKELKNELVARGHLFRTNSDTEVVVHAYETWGKHCVEHLRGMFAFAIVDLRKREVFIARDHLGIKPLFYVSAPSFFAFASELQALRCIPGVPLDIDIEALDQYLFLQYIPAPKTVFQQIRKLEPAHSLSVTFEGAVSEPEKYWKLEFKPDYVKKESEWIDNAESVIQDSIKAHLVSDVPFGAFLSGGIDSSCVVAYMSQLLNSPVKTFTIGFEEQEFNELDYAQRVAKRWSTEHYAEVLRPNALEILPLLVRHYGEPFGDSSAIPTYYVSQLAHQYVPMVLSGDGGDELFAGYGTYEGWVNLISGNNRPLWKRVGRRFGELLYPSRYPPRTVNLRTWFHIINIVSYQSRMKLWRPEFRHKCNSTISEFEEYFAETEGYELCSKAQYMDLHTYLPHNILPKVDVASMMHGLECRTPLVDIRVAEFAATIPQKMNMAKNGNGQLRGKTILKKLLRKYYGDEFLNRPKMGFSVPIQKWFSSTANLNYELSDVLLGATSQVAVFFQPREIKNLIDQNRGSPVWLLLFLNEWLKQFGEDVHLADCSTD